MVAGAVTHKFTVDEFLRLGEIGIFHEDSRVELIEGEIVCMAPIGHRHLGVVNSLNLLLSALGAARRAVVSIQNPVNLGERSDPQPDVALLRFRDDSYRGARPGSSDVLLIVEVADSSIEYDRLTKAPLYAEAGVPELWIVDLTQDHVEVYRGPRGRRYAETQVLARGAVLSPLEFPDVRIEVEDIIGP